MFPLFLIQKKGKKLLAAHYTTWKRERHFFDSEYEKIIQDIESKIPNKEVGISSENREEDIFIVLCLQ